MKINFCWKIEGFRSPSSYLFFFFFPCLVFLWEKGCWTYRRLLVLRWLEVNKCAFTFLSEIRQIQCTRTEFWCVQCPRPAGQSALDKHQIQASALDLSYFTSKSKCKFINLIHTRQKNKIICSCSWKIINQMVLKYHYINIFTQWKKWISLGAVVCAIMHQKHLAQSGRSLGAVHGVQWTFSIHSAYLLKSQSENKKFSWSVWIYFKFMVLLWLDTVC